MAKPTKNLMAEALEREVMPQLPEGGLKKVREKLISDGTLYTEERVELSKLQPSQTSVTKSKANEIYEASVNRNKIKPLIVSEEYKIIDGHHRYAGFLFNEDPTYKIPVFRIHVPVNECLNYYADMCSLINGNKEDLKKVVVYSGRFQPFHRGHFECYKHLCNRFGKNNVYIGATSKHGDDRSPFSFNQRKQIISTMFEVPYDHVVEVKNAYSPEEVMENFDSTDNIVYVAALGAKNGERLFQGGEYFKRYKATHKEEVETYENRGYVYEIPMQDQIEIGGQPISASAIRKIMRSDFPDDIKYHFLEQIYGKNNGMIFTMIDAVLNNKAILPESFVMRFLKEKFGTTQLYEASNNVAAEPDDGPTTWYKTPKEYFEQSSDVVTRLGYDVLDFMLDNHPDEEPYKMKRDGLPFNSFYATGVARSTAAPDPDRLYRPFVDTLATMLGNEIVNWTGITFDHEEEAAAGEAESGRVDPEDAEQELANRIFFNKPPNKHISPEDKPDAPGNSATLSEALSTLSLTINS